MENNTENNTVTNNEVVTETPKKNKNNGVLIFIIALIIGIVCGYFGYSYLNNKNENLQKVIEKESKEKEQDKENVEDKEQAVTKTYNKEDLNKWLEDNSEVLDTIQTFSSSTKSNYSGFLCNYILKIKNDSNIKEYDSSMSKPIKTDFDNVKELSKEKAKKLLDYYFENVPEMPNDFMSTCKSDGYFQTTEDENNYYFETNGFGYNSYISELNSINDKNNNKIEVVYKLSAPPEVGAVSGTRIIVLTYDFKIVSVKTKLG